MEVLERWAKLEKSVGGFWDRLQGPRKVGRWIARRSLSLIGLLLRLGAAVALAVLAYRVANDEVNRTDGLVTAGLIVAAFAILAMSPAVGRGLFTRLSKLSLGPVGLELVSDLEVAAAGERTEDKEAQDEEVTSVLDLRLKLERKLTYIAKDLLNTGDVPTFVTIGSLEYDGYISKLEAHTVDRLMALRDEDLALFDASERREFLAVANKVAANIRASVLNGMVRKLLEEGDWDLTEIPRSPRPDLLAEKDGKRFQVVPVFALDENSRLLESAKTRLRPDADPRPRAVANRVIVVPHRSSATRDGSGEIEVVDTDGLQAALERLSAD